MSKTFYNNTGQMVGELKEGIYRKVVSKKLHFMKVLNAWGIDERIVKELVDLGCREIRIRDKDTENIYSAPFNRFTEKGFVKDFASPQRFLTMKYWHITNKGKVIQEVELDKNDMQGRLL